MTAKKLMEGAGRDYVPFRCWLPKPPKEDPMRIIKIAERFDRSQKCPER